MIKHQLNIIAYNWVLMDLSDERENLLMEAQFCSIHFIVFFDMKSCTKEQDKNLCTNPQHNLSKCLYERVLVSCQIMQHPLPYAANHNQD